MRNVRRWYISLDSCLMHLADWFGPQPLRCITAGVDEATAVYCAPECADKLHQICIYPYGKIPLINFSCSTWNLTPYKPIFPRKFNTSKCISCQMRTQKGSRFNNWHKSLVHNGDFYTLWRRCDFVNGFQRKIHDFTADLICGDVENNPDGCSLIKALA